MKEDRTDWNANYYEPFDGPNGERVSFSQLIDGGSVPCAGLESGRTCTFNVDFVVERLEEQGTARLLVEITKTDRGEDFCDDPFPQGDGVVVTPAQGGGQLSGVLGSPVSNEVRFNLAIELLDSTGRRIAVIRFLIGSYT